jgi:site-specific DNA-methyltransferase (adenine-specific)
MTPYYQDDSVTLYQGDALAVLRSLPDHAADGLVTDPPYSSGGMVRGDRTQSTRTKYTDSDAQHEIPDFTGDNRDQRAYGYWCALWLSECLRVLKPGAPALLFTDWRQLPMTTDALQAGGFVWRGIVPWVKPSARPMSGRFTNQAEYVVWGSAGSMGLDFTDSTFPGFYQASAPREREHITQKPVDVMRKLVRIVDVGGVVLDPFMGSGTTGVASVLEGRGFIGSEMAAHFADVAERRIRESSGHAVSRSAQDVLDFGSAS